MIVKMYIIGFHDPFLLNHQLRANLNVQLVNSDDNKNYLVHNTYLDIQITTPDVFERICFRIRFKTSNSGCFFSLCQFKLNIWPQTIENKLSSNV
jgi:hypothetical protein